MKTLILGLTSSVSLAALALAALYFFVTLPVEASVYEAYPQMMVKEVAGNGFKFFLLGGAAILAGLASTLVAILTLESLR